MTETYSKYRRRGESVTVTEVGTGGTVTTDAGWSWCPGFTMELGRHYFIETIRGSQVVAVMDEQTGRQLMDKSDQDIDREDVERRAMIMAEREERLAANRDEWARREAALRPELRGRLEHFRAESGGKFDADGWGYELVVCELTQLYIDSGGQDARAIDAYARREGTSGNQHDYAKALAKAMRDDPQVARGSVSALTPITGQPFYAGTK